MSDWLDRRVIAFAHQGGSFEGPSSTLGAIEQAAAAGATAIELDVHATADGQLVVCHDATVDATTNGHGAIAAMTLAQLRELDSAYWFTPGATATPGREASAYPWRGRAPVDRRYGVATLEEVVAAVPGVLLNLDIKQTAPDVRPYESLLAREIERLECAHRVIVASFLDRAIESFRREAPSVATSAATEETATFFFSSLEGHPVVPPAVAFQVPETYGDVTVVDERFVEAAHNAGVAVHVWTINDQSGMDRLLDLGVDGLVSDRPSMLAETIARRVLTWDGAC